MNFENERLALQELYVILRNGNSKNIETFKILNSINEFDAIKPSQMKVIVKKITIDFEKNKMKFQNQLIRENYDRYKLILLHLNEVSGLEKFSKKDLIVIETILYRNFKDLVILDENSKCYYFASRDNVCKEKKVKWFDLDNWTSFISRLEDENSSLNFISGIICYINSDNPQKEMIDNSEIISSEDVLGKIKYKTRKFGFMDVRSFENRIDYLIMDNER